LGSFQFKLPPNKNSLNLKTRTKLKKLKFNPVLVQITQSTWVTRQDHGFNHGSSVGAAGSPKALCVLYVFIQKIGKEKENSGKRKRYRLLFFGSLSKKRKEKKEREKKE
jgi:hypothetical protein